MMIDFGETIALKASIHQDFYKLLIGNHKLRYQYKKIDFITKILPNVIQLCGNIRL